MLVTDGGGAAVGMEEVGRRGGHQLVLAAGLLGVWSCAPARPGNRNAPSPARLMGQQLADRDAGGEVIQPAHESLRRGDLGPLGRRSGAALRVRETRWCRYSVA